MTTPTISILPSNFRKAVTALEQKGPEAREAFLAGPVESFAISEFENVEVSLGSWDNVPGLDADDREGFVDVALRNNRFQAGHEGDRHDGASTSMSVEANGISAMHVEFSKDGVDLYRLRQQDGVLTGTHMHCDRVTGEAYLVRL